MDAMVQCEPTADAAATDGAVAALRKIVAFIDARGGAEASGDMGDAYIRNLAAMAVERSTGEVL